MKRVFILVSISAFLALSCKSKKEDNKTPSPSTAVAGPGGIRCDQFKKNPDGSWSPTSQITISDKGASVTLSPGTSFQPGQTAFLGLDIGTWLNNNCK